jgi:uncharacterized protein
VKEVAADGTFQGVASVYGVEDLGGDIIDRGAFTKTIAENPIIPILWQHDSHEVIGSGEVKEWQGKILLAGQLDLDDPTGQKAYKKLKSKLIKGLSIGFQAVKSTFAEVVVDGATKYIRRIQELKLWEVSVVTFPMLPQAQVTRVKSMESDARLKALEDKVSALSAANATQITEPAKAEEPQRKAPEPAVSHSGLIDCASSLSALLRKGESK